MQSKEMLTGMCLSLSGFVMSGLSLMVVPRLGLLYLFISLAVGLGSSCLAFVSADVIRVYFSKCIIIEA